MLRAQGMVASAFSNVPRAPQPPAREGGCWLAWCRWDKALRGISSGTGAWRWLSWGGVTRPAQTAPKTKSINSPFSLAGESAPKTCDKTQVHSGWAPGPATVAPRKVRYKPELPPWGACSVQSTLSHRPVVPFHNGPLKKQGPEFHFISWGN